MTKVKRVKLDALSKIQPDYAGADGVYNPNTDTIYIDATLPRTARPTYGTALAHEQAHALISKLGIGSSFRYGYEERFCWLYALAIAPRNSLTHIEEVCKRLIFNKLSWKRQRDRQQIAATITALCHIQPTREIVTKLSGVK